MAGTLFTSTDLDLDGRQVVASDSIQDVYYYSAVGESWDRFGTAGQSWFRELYLPNDSFDTTEISSERWTEVDTPATSTSTLAHVDGSLSLGIEGDDGVVGLSSDGKWRLSGDFDIRLYFDWDSYYNEYRSIAHTFLKVGYDDSNAVRAAFTFDGVDGYQFSSEVADNRDLRFFDWVDNGTPEEAGDIDNAKDNLYLKITREGDLIKTFRSTGTADVQIGNTISGTVFGQDLYVEMGIETKEFNRYRHGFRKFFVFSGDITPNDRFFSPIRGEKQEFPETSILVMDTVSLSIIDEAEGKLWLRLPVGEESPIPDNTSKIAACNGVVYLTTSAGIVALDFHQDKIFRYRDDLVQVADEPLALRNSEVTFRTYLTDVGDFPTNSFNYIDCKRIGSEDYIAATYDDGVVLFRALGDGVAYSEDGPSVSTKVRISDKGALYWVGYDLNNNLGELSYFSNVVALALPGTTPFNRTDYYGTDTTLEIFGSHITSFDVRTVQGVDLIGVGTTAGLTFLSFSPGAVFTDSFTYGVVNAPDNPFTDPSFENYIGLDWQPYVRSFQKKFILRQDTSWVSDDGDNSLRMRFQDINDGDYTAGDHVGVYQMVDLTDVPAVYFDARMGTPGLSATSIWNLEFLVDDVVVKSVPDTDAPFERFNDSVDVSAYEGVHKFSIQIRFHSTSSPVNAGTRNVQIDNLQTKLGDPQYRILPAGNASMVEVLLQYDSEGHKLYFSTLQGYGALDLDDHSLDYFIPVQTFVPGAQNNTAEFSRVEDEV